jgi:hypothetical protein
MSQVARASSVFSYIFSRRSWKYEKMKLLQRPTLLNAPIILRKMSKIGRGV